ncbi:hypothetical protein KCTC52924_00851 [Arenibacter antarcticus]|uniref:Sialidase family protein n=1 Tax=Arenibacter antarcticus TaxID=2040469 RepID=A0ABW5VC36_9FLAO|nr:sialidase family protein [Arenibacter sp. H213]MCM4167639.1 glycosyl hydrolase [Arenibacter sp. H213]
MKRITIILFSLLSYYCLNSQKLDDSKVPGVKVAYSPASSGKYIGSPSLAILPNGDYVASHDYFGPESNEHVRATSKIYTSKNSGKSWREIATIDGAFWSKLFVKQDKLWFLGTDRHHGNTLMRLSEDGGRSWTSPTDGSNGLLLEGEYHCAPMPILEYNGRIWRAMESAMGPIKKWGKRYGAFMLSAPVDADLLDANSWTSSNTLYHDASYLDGNFGGWIEGNAVVNKDGQMLNILRVDDRSTLDEKAAFVKISADGKNASFNPNSGFMSFPGGSKKFTIRYDEASGLYWTIANVIPEGIKKDHKGKNPAFIRNTQALFSSPDLVQWDQRKVLLQHQDVLKHGFQYVDWMVDGKDIIFLSRTAYDDGIGGARNNHDANFLTFHRIKKFRKLLK